MTITLRPSNKQHPQMKKVAEFTPSTSRTVVPKSWFSTTTKISITLKARLLREQVDGYCTDTLRALVIDLSSDLQSLKANRSALMQHLNNAGAGQEKIFAEVARIDTRRAPLAKAYSILNHILESRKRSSAPSWHQCFYKAARHCLDAQTLKAIQAKATDLQHEALSKYENKSNH